MPLKRTPPKTPAAKDSESTTCTNTFSKAGSFPNLSTPDTEYINTRKRKRDDDYNSFMELLKSHSDKTDKKLESLQSSLAEIITQNSEIKNTITFISQKYDEMLLRTEQIEAERKADRIYINQLEDRVENLERMMNMSKMEIKNIPKMQGETKDDLRKLVTETACFLEIPLQEHDIRDVFRVNKKEGVSTIIVDFAKTKTKEDFVKSARQYNKKNSANKLNSTHIKISGPAKPIYMSESLTLKAQRLFYLARRFAKDNDYRFCWTSYGKVFMKKTEGDKHILIKDEPDINKLQKCI